MQETVASETHCSPSPASQALFLNAFGEGFTVIYSKVNFFFPYGKKCKKVKDNEKAVNLKPCGRTSQRF